MTVSDVTQRFAPVPADQPADALEQRLLARWREHGRADHDAGERVASNDLPNVDRVLARRREPDLVV